MSQIKNTTEYWKNIEEEEDNIMKNEKMDMVAVENTVVEKEHEKMENKIVSMGFVPETDIVRIKQGIVGEVPSAESCIVAKKVMDGSGISKMEIILVEKNLTEIEGLGKCRNMNSLGTFTKPELREKKVVNTLLMDGTDVEDIKLLIKTILDNWNVIEGEADTVVKGSNTLIVTTINFIKEHMNDECNFTPIVDGKRRNKIFGEDDKHYYINTVAKGSLAKKFLEEHDYSLMKGLRLLADSGWLEVENTISGGKPVRRFTCKRSGMKMKGRVSCYAIRKKQSESILTLFGEEAA